MFEKLGNGGYRTKYGIAVNETWLKERNGRENLMVDVIELGYGFYLLKSPTVSEVMEAVHPGLTYDLAVPQGWWDEMYEKNGEGPFAVWAYPDSGEHHVFGKPMMIADVFEEYKKLVLAELLPF